MSLNKYDALHIFTILWLSTVSISLISLSIRHEQTDHRLQESLDALENQSNNNPFIPERDIGLDIDRNNERDSVKVEEEKRHVNSEPMNDIEDEKISVDVREQDLVQEVEDITISLSQSRHKEKPAKFESALNAFSDELERYESSKRKKRGDTAFHRQLSNFDVDSREHTERSRASFQHGRQRNFFLKSLSEKVEQKDKHDKSIIGRSHYRKASHTSTDLTLLKLDSLQHNEKFMKGTASQKNKKSIEAIENGNFRNRRLESHMNNDITPYRTSCVLTKAEVSYSCHNIRKDCIEWALDGYCTNTTLMPKEDWTFDKWMAYNCRRSCNDCYSPVSLSENQIQHNEFDNTATTFDLSIDVSTDFYPDDTSWILLSQDYQDSIIDSSEVSITSVLEGLAKYKFNYNCIIPHNEENQNITSTCYNFEVHDLFGDGMCCMYGAGFFSMSLKNMNDKTFHVSNEFEDGSVMGTSFCIDHNDGDIESEGIFIIDGEEPTDYPSPKPTDQPTTKELRSSHYSSRWQCKNEVCICDSKPSLSGKIQENHTHAFLFEVTLLSDSDKLQDVESPQYKAACWVLYDDPFEYESADEGAHARRIQRYILTVFYFATSPKEWKWDYSFLSSLTECHWGNISCNDDDIVISIDLFLNNLGGTIVDELSGLRMLEDLKLFSNNIRGTIPSTLGRLSELRYLNLGGNDLEGTIPPQLFDAKNLEELRLYENRLEGTIPETIGNLQELSRLSFYRNALSGSIPDGIYKLKNLEVLSLHDNKLSSSISPLIENLNKLEVLWLSNNILIGQIPSTIGNLPLLYSLGLSNNRLSGSFPSTIGNLTSLFSLFLNNNTLSGPIPESLFDLPDMMYLYLQDNSVRGSVPDEFCKRFDEYDYVFADCRNNVFDPEVSCSCCKCTDKSPTWDGGCADTTVKVVIDHGSNGDYDYDSFNLEWSLTNDATGKKILNDGPYPFGKKGLQSYEACMAHSDCFSFKKNFFPQSDTNYQIYWSNNIIYNGTFRGYENNNYINRTDPRINYQAYALNDEGINRDDPLLSFSYDDENQQLASSCYTIKLKCYEEKQKNINLEPNTIQRIIYNEAVKISGRSSIQDTSSPQSKALCWMLQNNPNYRGIDKSDTEIKQRYVLAILHFMSTDGLFGDDYPPPITHECDWSGINCTNNNSKIVTDISISNKVMNGRLIDEIGSLQYLEVLELHNTKLSGTIPRSFSNLWSLRKLDLSNNKMSSTIPTTLFHHLNKLEHIDLSDNSLSGSINKDIDSYSHIRSLFLRNNSLTGPFPLETFKHTDLEHLDISDNEMNGIDFSLLLKHNNLKILDLSNNFFVVTLHENTFTTLINLEYFNISQNDISGTIPSTFPELSNITHLDMHRNRLKGPIPLDVVKLINIQYLNLQGNQLTGSLPNQINQLKSLKTLVLSHNELKGSIPFDNTALQKLDELHLHNNKLSGEAPKFSTTTSFITDCGHPSDSLEPVSCSSCNTCCNSDGTCQSKSSEKFSQVHRTLIFMFTIIGFIIICYILKNIITTNKHLRSFFEEIDKNWNALTMISDKSIYHFFLMRNDSIKNKISWCVAFFCCMFQTATLLLFVHSTDMVNETSDREYSMVCPSNSLKCETNNRVSSYGTFIFSIILAVWLLRDMIGSVKLMLLSFEKKNIDFFFTSAIVFSVTMLSLWTSIIYIDAIAVKNTDMIKDAVILLFVLEMDERLFQLVERIDPKWVKDIESNMSGSYEGKNLMISSMIEEFHKWKKY